MSNVCVVLPDGHVISSQHGGWGGAGLFDLPCPFQSDVNMPTSSHHVKLALYVDDTAIIAMSCKPTLLDSCREYLNDLQRWSIEWRIAINVSKSNAFLSPALGDMHFFVFNVTMLSSSLVFLSNIEISYFCTIGRGFKQRFLSFQSTIYLHGTCIR